MQSNVFTLQGQVYLGCNPRYFSYNDFVRLQQLGEFGLIARIAHEWKDRTPSHWVGIGDDCAVLPFPREASPEITKLLVTTDMLVEHVHFLLSSTPPDALGHKALAVNVSDIAAMGGIPTTAFLSLALPQNLSVEWVDDFFQGFNKLAQYYDIVLAGGDTTRSMGPVVVNVTLVGQGEPKDLKTRAGAQSGDVICVTGTLGDSGGGLQLLLKHPCSHRTPAEHWLLAQHHRPRPHLKEGQ